MPRLIRAEQIIEDHWLPVDADATVTAAHQILTLEQWLALADKAGRAVQLEPDQAPSVLFDHLAEIPLIAIHFPVFTDGRGFSHARELRNRGYLGELRACGHIIRDQMTYLRRCGVDAFQLADESQLEEALESLHDFSEYYQASVDQPLPLFRRRG
jgi:uncharacterized protein (DUF934 family)